LLVAAPAVCAYSRGDGCSSMTPCAGWRIRSTARWLAGDHPAGLTGAARPLTGLPGVETVDLMWQRAPHSDKQKRHRWQATCGTEHALAERAGFEPAEVLPSHDFQSCAFDRTMLPLLDPCDAAIIPLMPECAKSAPWHRLPWVEGGAWYLGPSLRRLKFDQFSRKSDLGACNGWKNSV
jgi:hypothetical protein